MFAVGRLSPRRPPEVRVALDPRWLEIMEEPLIDDHSDDVCPCGNPDCYRPFGHSEHEHD